MLKQLFAAILMTSFFNAPAYAGKAVCAPPNSPENFSVTVEYTSTETLNEQEKQRAAMAFREFKPVETSMLRLEFGSIYQRFQKLAYWPLIIEHKGEVLFRYDLFDPNGLMEVEMAERELPFYLKNLPASIQPPFTIHIINVIEDFRCSFAVDESGNVSKPTITTIQ